MNLIGRWGVPRCPTAAFFLKCDRVTGRKYCQAAVFKEDKTLLLKHIHRCILANGPMSVHDYMREVLVSPLAGYYMNRDVFGKTGDFTTSPEISQMFGEMIAVWLLNEWAKAGMPKPVHLVEIGPGRGTLSEDILRVFAKYKDLTDSLRLHLVEVSPFLAKVQEERLCGTSSEIKTDDNKHDHYKMAVTKSAVPVVWYKDVQLVPSGFTLFLAHEFLDALPVYKFEKTTNGWREIVVEIDDNPNSPFHLRLALARNSTPATVLINPQERRQHVEICPQAGAFVEHIARRLDENGGASLIVDYGHSGENQDTFRAFKNHQLHEPLSLPGEADLTADVDFEYLKRCINDKALTFGPVTQGSFLTTMGMGLRLRKLLEVVRSRNEGEQLITGYDMLVNPKHMGERFKFFAMFPKQMTDTLESNPPAGFTEEVSPK